MNMNKTKAKKQTDFIDFDEMKKRALRKKNFKREYDALEFEYEIIRALIKKRLDKKLSQRDLAQITGMQQSSIARIESCNSSPTLSVVSRIFSKLGAKVKVS